MALRIWPADAVAGAPSNTGRSLRQALMSLIGAGVTAARPLGARSGVRPGTPSSTVTATATVWTVKPHAGMLDVQAAAEASAYSYAVDANVTGAVTAANATNPRIDLVYVQLADPAEGDGTAAPGINVLYLAGVAAASPAAPALPARSMALARINVPKAGGGAPSVSWIAPYLQSGIWPVRDQAERLAMPIYGTYEAPALVRQADTGVVWEHDGVGWSAAQPRALVWQVKTTSVILVGISTSQVVLTVSLPADAPAGRYNIDATMLSRSDGAVPTYTQIYGGGLGLPGFTDAADNPGAQDVARSVTQTMLHAGGAVDISLALQINGGSVAWNRSRPGTSLRVTYLGRA